ncbi:BamA/TamA family outer membrane protein [Wenyingzhuangia sp. IMCC45533]
MKVYYLKITVAFTAILLMCNTLQAQKDEESEKKFEDFKEFFVLHPNKKRAAQDPEIYKSRLILAPIISFAPETSLGIGVGAKYLFKFKGSGEETRTSNMPMTLQYTLKNQFILFSGFELFTPQEKWVIEGNFSFQNFPRAFYGIGPNSLESDEEIYDSFQLLFEPVFLKKMFFDYLFVGGGVRVNKIFNVDIDPNENLSQLKPLGYKGSTSVGTELAVLYDSRDNILNARKGTYIKVTHGFYDKAFGSSQNFQLTRFDARYFLQPFKNRDDVLGFHAIGRATHNDVPLSELALLGGSDILRGYTEGRYIDSNLLAAQMEYRTQIKGRLGLVAFVGAGNVADKIGNFKLSTIKPNFGLGLRFLLDREERLNIRLDWGFGEDTNSLYLNIAESF